uniref:Cytochrome c oxidase subunit 3 n=1 Tax=Oxyuris equi TaxID=132389 RepID=A0A0G2T6F6_9BILA|nr:cytochrome c oxidase subunit III [Oxyuris equi]AKI07541.1 cytochrome c oxidase subunit 3 [Oxyuris equi]
MLRKKIEGIFVGFGSEVLLCFKKPMGGVILFIPFLWGFVWLGFFCLWGFFLSVVFLFFFFLIWFFWLLIFFCGVKMFMWSLCLVIMILLLMSVWSWVLLFLFWRSLCFFLVFFGFFWMSFYCMVMCGDLYSVVIWIFLVYLCLVLFCCWVVGWLGLGGMMSLLVVKVFCCRCCLLYYWGCVFFLCSFMNIIICFLMLEMGDLGVFFIFWRVFMVSMLFWGWFCWVLVYFVCFFIIILVLMIIFMSVVLFIGILWM